MFPKLRSSGTQFGNVPIRADLDDEMRFHLKLE